MNDKNIVLYEGTSREKVYTVGEIEKELMKKEVILKALISIKGASA